MSFSYKQTRILSIIPHITGPISAFGSGWIIYEILRDKSRWQKSYHRILFSMCVFDFLSSVALFFSTWPIPQDSVGVYAPSGTTATCSAQAFFIQANIASPLYNFVLSIYYLLRVRYGVSEEVMSHRVEPWLQGVTIAFALGTSVTALGLGLLNDSSLWCWINAIPKGCQQSYKFGRDEGTCERGDNAEIFRWAFFFAPLWAAVVGTMISMGLLYQAVRAQEKRTERWDFIQRAQSDNLSSSAVNITESAEQAAHDRVSAIVEAKRKERRNNRKSKMVAAQAFRYVAVFYVTWVAGTANRLLQLTRGESVFKLMFLHAIFTPLQGTQAAYGNPPNCPPDY